MVTEDPFARVSELFEAARELAAEKRAAFLDHACGDEHAMRAEVESLLTHHDAACSFLNESPVSASVLADQLAGDHGTRDSSMAGPPKIVPGVDPQRVGPYKIIDVLGDGRMGVVYLAEQEEPIRRRVALKLIKPGMDTKEVMARFESERQAVALMDHSSIARVYDAGATESGRPYFAMEYVAGLPITAYCDAERLNTDERLRLFVRTCEAVQHAHQKGIIHRDIKPSNILVIREGDKPIPKVIDFGIAKATGLRLTEETLTTHLGHALGTQAYMSPEQVDLATHDIDTRSDIYSLGVVLYELLVGVLPFDFQEIRKRGYSELARVIRESETPAPSTRLRSLHDEATTKALAENRRTDVTRHTRRLRADLDWIVLTALAKDRSRRYATASELAADIERHLAHEPVAASARSLWGWWRRCGCIWTPWRPGKMRSANSFPRVSRRRVCRSEKAT